MTMSQRHHLPALFRQPQMPILLLLVLLALFFAQAALAVPDPDPYLLPEFLNIPFNSTDMPPESEQAIKSGKFDLKKVAVSLVQRKRLFQDRWKRAGEEVDVPDSFPRSCDDVEILSFFPEQHIDSLIKDGQLNMHQTGESRGLTQLTIRAKAENSMIGIKLESVHDANPKSPMHYLRPKYGLVNFPRPCGVRMNPNRLLIYGQVIVVYNDIVKARTMYSYGDSLFSFCHYAAGELSEFLEPHSMLEFGPPEKKAYWDVRYVEAQIWGPIDLSDIREFRIPAERKDLLEKLKKAGKPIYAYSRENMENCDYHMDEALIGIGRGAELYNPRALPASSSTAP
jgi:hypothetical protein